MVSLTDLPALEIPQPGEFGCIHCSVTHSDDHLNFPHTKHSCRSSQQAAGPKIMHYLQESNQWQQNCAIICVLLDNSPFRYLPSNLTPAIMHICYPEMGSYIPCLDPQQGIDTSSPSLFARLHHALRLAVNYPFMTIMVEFAEAKVEGVPLWNHIVGFLTVIQRVQVNHCQRIVVLLSPVLPNLPENEMQYRVRKWHRQSRNDLLSLGCTLFGIAFFRPMITHQQLPTQQVGSSQSLRRSRWLREPLVNLEGVTTRETLRRIELEFSHYLQWSRNISWYSTKCGVEYREEDEQEEDS